MVKFRLMYYNMSDDFITMATKEILDDVLGIEQIYKTCSSDDDIFNKSSKFQVHTHKIKGLAPMMGKEQLGALSALLDGIMKKANDGKKFPGIFDILQQTIFDMKKSLEEPNYDLTLVTSNIKKNLSDVD